MKIGKTARGFTIIEEEKYQNERGVFTRLIQESSAIGNYKDAWNYPGSSFLWVGEDHHLNRKQVRELIRHLQYWLNNKHLRFPKRGNK